MSALKPFSTVTYGKWILSGEHSVLRGQEAIVLPLFSKKLQFNYTPNFDSLSGVSTKRDLQIKTQGCNAEDIESIVRALLSKALTHISQEVPAFYGTIEIFNEIPLGSGLGASSSLCVAFGRWFEFMGLIENSQVYEFSRQLENLFHGESSGVDIAVVLNEKPLIFKRPNQIQIVKNYFKTHLYLTYSGQRGVTKDCVEKVKKIFLTDKIKAETLDLKMLKATEDFKKFYLLQDEFFSDEKRWEAVAHAINKASEVFRDWGLTQGALDQHMEQLKKLGAKACKPTGSGGGGYVLSLWDKEVDFTSPDFEFISIT
ncbi:MAG: hypothetical protein HUU56_08635 [Bdellovibrionaceae bacterium]|nr:hypothetical protein [Pseudobdellovibrionaceae bacterium]